MKVDIKSELKLGFGFLGRILMGLGVIALLLMGKDIVLLIGRHL